MTIESSAEDLRFRVMTGRDKLRVDRRHFFVCALLILAVLSHFTSLLFLDMYTPHVVIWFVTVLVLGFFLAAIPKANSLAACIFFPYGLYVLTSLALESSWMPPLSDGAKIEALAYIAFPAIFFAICGTTRSGIVTTQDITRIFIILSITMILIAAGLGGQAYWSRQGMIDNHGPLVTHLAYGITVSLPFWYSRTSITRIAGMIPLAAIAASFAIILFLLESRAGILGIGVGVMIYSFLRLPALVFSFRMVSIGVIFFLTLLSWDSPLVQRFQETPTSFGAYLNFLTMSTDEVHNISLSDERAVAISASAAMFSEYPIFGGGYHMLTAYSLDKWSIGVAGHGMFTTIPAESGMVGFLLFLFPIAYIVRLIFRLKKMQVFLASPAMAAIVSGFGTTLFFGVWHQAEYDQYFYILGAAIVGLYHSLLGGSSLISTRLDTHPAMATERNVHA